MISQSGEKLSISPDELHGLVVQAVEAAWARQAGSTPRAGNRVLILPPDHTRLHSMAGPITVLAFDWLREQGVAVDVMPTLGTHNAMSEAQVRMMFGDTIPLDCFKIHDWRRDVVRVGEISGDIVAELSAGEMDDAVEVEVNKRLFEGYDLILSIGQVVPHEVVGMANYTKNIVVGAGGADLINKSHFLGAVSNMEKGLGRTDTPVRRLLNYAVDTFLEALPIEYVLTVMEQDSSTGEMQMRGFFAGDEDEVFQAACALSRSVNITLLARAPRKVVVYLDPREFQSTWLGNKAIYRTRMAIADGGALIVLAPALKEFGEDPTIDQLIRQFGYRGTPATLKAVEEHEALRGNLSAAAHLIHGSSEGRFSITYCPGDEGLTCSQIQSVGFDAVPYREMITRYHPEQLHEGFNTLPDGEEIFYISNPALGLWALEDTF